MLSHAACAGHPGLLPSSSAAHPGGMPITALAASLTRPVGVQYSYRVINDSYDTSVCLQYEPVVIAASCILLTALARRMEVRPAAPPQNRQATSKPPNSQGILPVVALIRTQAGWLQAAGLSPRPGPPSCP